MTDTELALIHYDGNNAMPYCDLVYKALKEMQKKQHDCPWCKAEYTIIDDDFGQPIRTKMIKYCFKCGKTLEDKT